MLTRKMLPALMAVALLSGGAFAKPASSSTPPSKPANTTTANANAQEGVLEKVDAKSVTISQKGKPMTYSLASGYAPDKALKSGARVKVELDGSHKVTKISKA